MADSVRGAVRDRLRRPEIVLFWVAYVVFLFWMLDGAMVQLGVTLVTAVVFGASELLTDVYDLRSDVQSLGLAFMTLLGSLSLFAFGGSDSDMGAAVVFALAGGWMALDATQTLRHEGWKEDTHDRDGREVYHEYVVRRADSELRERALTRRELGNELDADKAAIDRALDTLAERGLLSRNGSELGVSSPPQPGPLERARSGIAASLARLARPLTIEFADDASDDGARFPPVGESFPENSRERDREPA